MAKEAVEFRGFGAVFGGRMYKTCKWISYVEGRGGGWWGKASRTRPRLWLERRAPSETAVTGGTQASCVAVSSLRCPRRSSVELMRRQLEKLSLEIGGVDGPRPEDLDYNHGV